MEQKKIKVEEFTKDLINSYENSCISCKFFNPSKDYCKERQIAVYRNTPKCNKWRYFA
jgi:hypothetical protein